MPEAERTGCRLCLVTPQDIEPVEFAALLGDALGGGDVASVIVTAAPERLQRAAEAITPIAQASGVAVLVHNDSRIAGRARADGVHIDSGLEDLGLALGAKQRSIVGAGGLRSRHDAMSAGELDPDYVFFGRLDGDSADHIFAKAFDLAAWWASMFVIPAMVMGGRSVQSARQAASAGIEFVALRHAVWEHPDGPAAAVAEANRLLTLPEDVT